MAKPAGNCPQCGARIEFRFAQAVQTVCPFCRSVLVRHDVDLARVGEVAALPAGASPIQLGTEGIHGKKAFQVAGRIVYEYEHGGWNEWHLYYHDGSSGWLSDAQAEYAVSALARPPGKLPQAGEIFRGKQFTWNGAVYEVTSITRARYVGVEGELPFEYWDKTECLFADLRTSDGRFATIDYSEPEPLVFLGAFASFDELRLKNLRAFEGW